METIKKFEPLWGEWTCTEVLCEDRFGRILRAVKDDENGQQTACVRHISLPLGGSPKNDYLEMNARALLREVDVVCTLPSNDSVVSCSEHIMIPKEDGSGFDLFIRMEPLNVPADFARGRFDQTSAVKLGIALCAALNVYSQVGAVHRDISISDIFTDEKGNYKLGNYGLAKVLGSAADSYRAPEIMRGTPADVTADIYSLGILLYKLLNNGRGPFMPADAADMAAAQQEAVRKAADGEVMQPPLNANAQVAAVILRACDSDRNYRFSSPDELASALSAALEGSYFAQRAAAAQEAAYTQPPAYSAPAYTPTYAPAYAPVQSQAPVQTPVQEPAAPKKKSGWKAFLVIFLLVLLAALGAGGYYVYNDIIVPRNQYAKALELMEAGQYDAAKDEFMLLLGYEDSTEKVAECEKYLEYEDATELMRAGDYEGAKKIFDSLGDFESSAQYSEQCDLIIRYNAAAEVMAEGKYEEAEELYTALGDYEDSSELARKASIWKLSDAHVGEIVEFGSYEQDNDEGNGKEPIRWIVLENNSDGVFLVSEQTLDCIPYHNVNQKEITWEKCSLRTWLNDSFYSEAFDSYEKSFISTTTVYADSNPHHGTTGGATTNDKVFILSLSEIKRYFPTNTDRRCIPTEYAAAKGVHTSINYSGSGWWWVRTPGYNRAEAVWIRVSGEPEIEVGRNLKRVDLGVRPAIWLSFEG